MTEKSLRDRLSESSENAGSKRAAARLAKFLKLWKEVDEAFREGWSYKEIWRVLNRDGQIDFSYSSFINFVRKVRRRRLDREREGTRKPGADPRAPIAPPGSGRMEMPLFGKDAPPREPRRF